MPLETWLTLLAATVVVFAIPGPTVLMVVTLAAARGRRVALAAATGVALGDFVAALAVMAGLGALVLASATAFTVLKWLGAAWLIWLGIRMLRAEADPAGAAEPAPGEGWAVLRGTFAVTALNPKSIGFLVAFVPQFVDPARPALPQLAAVVGTMAAVGFANSGTYALLAAWAGGRLRRPSVRRAMTRAGGAVLIGMGLLTATARRA
ncbi:threonine/homoserine/homoserine lactone efflux protein [Hasllibacter halocynthiae]|uniref:Threonine/homoserine/homoserine lactone efflux protein n=1 Tax=Hasllibacter halocynthiae TaxID=595589 RepID=A0A2T0X8W1_9RHOB|nr:LysE family translocator [Hasllibacter halocynthiae]PRY95304.1 threonine/homoserine/homoserine lactone efflux protein [Hasllibacter halocynthiae]